MKQNNQKLKKHYDKINYVLTHPILSTLIWEATRNCNFACAHCCIPKGDWKKEKELTTNQVKKIFLEVAEDFNPQEIFVAITGGEATLRKDLVEIVKFLTNLSFSVGVDSNGYNYARDLSLLDKLIEAGICSGTIGVDGLKEGYKKTRGIDCFDKIMEVLKYAVKKYPETYITTFTVVNNYNKDEIPELFDRLANIGIKYGRINIVTSVGRALTLDENFLKLSIEDFYNLLEWISKKREEYKNGKFPMEIEFSDEGWCGIDYECSIKREENIFLCSTGILVGSILYDGKIGACPHLERELTVQGDALTQRFSEVWKNKFQLFRDKDWLKKEKCSLCNQWDYCRGGPMHYRDINGNMRQCIYDQIKKVKDYRKIMESHRNHTSKTRIAIIGAENETHCLYMKQVLEERGSEVLIIDTLNFPEKITFSLTENSAIYQGKNIDSIKAFYARSVFYSQPPYDLEDQRKAGKLDWDGWYSDYVAERERQSLLSSWLKYLTLQGKEVVNPIDSFDFHYLKPYQLAVLHQNNIPVPKTLVTNNSDELLRFKKMFTSIIYKPVAGGTSCKKLLDTDLTPERLQLLQNAPVIFQEEIKGLNIRVYVIGNQVISANIIHTEEIDYRGNEESIEKIKLPASVEKMCIQAMQLCKMKFTGIDLKKKPSGEYVLIECNPSPMFTGIEKTTGDPISKYLADYLIAHGK